jgi:hypothetical protein
MYVDMDLKQRRARNIIVSGLPYCDDDLRAVGDLLAEEFRLKHIPVVICRRIGRRVANRVRLLLVTLESREDADYFVANAKKLRGSYDAYVQDHVFISADLTPAEAKAAYELRCRRREKERRQYSALDQPSVPGRVFYRSSGSSAAVSSGAPQAVGGELTTPTLRYRLTTRQPTGQPSSSASAVSGVASADGDRPISSLHYRMSTEQSVGQSLSSVSGPTVGHGEGRQ